MAGGASETRALEPARSFSLSEQLLGREAGLGEEVVLNREQAQREPKTICQEHPNSPFTIELATIWEEY